MEGRIKLITAPTIEPVTVDEVKMHTHIDHDVEDDLLASWIKSGREIAETYQRRAYITQTWELTFDSFPSSQVIYIPRPPLQLTPTITVKYYDYTGAETSLALTNFTIDDSSSPARMILAYGVTWPGVTLRDITSLKIRYACGYGSTAASVPDHIKDAIQLYCAYRNENRAGEVGLVPKQFYSLLASDRIYL